MVPLITKKEAWTLLQVINSLHQHRWCWVSNRFQGPIGILMSAYADLGMVAQNPGKYDEYTDLANQLMIPLLALCLNKAGLRVLQVPFLPYLTLFKASQN